MSDEGLEVGSPPNVRPGLWRGASHGYTLFLSPNFLPLPLQDLFPAPGHRVLPNVPKISHRNSQKEDSSPLETGLFSWVAEEKDTDGRTLRENLTQWFLFLSSLG